MAPVLPSLSQLTTLILRSNLITGASPVPEALRSLTRLTCLDLNDNELGADGAEAVCSVLSHLTSLTSLSLGDNRMGATGGHALAAVLPHLVSLKELDLKSMCKMLCCGR